MAAPRTGSLGVADTLGDIYVLTTGGDITRLKKGTDGQALVVETGAVNDQGEVIDLKWKDAGLIAKASFQADAVDAVFKAVIVPPEVASIANPTPKVRGTHSVLEFNAGVLRGIPWQKYMPTDYSGGDLRVTVSWVQDGVAAGNVLWGAAFERDNSGFDIDVDGFAANVPFAVSAAPGVAGQIVEASAVLTNAQADLIVTGEPLRLYIQRNGADVADTLADKAMLVRVVVEEV